MSSEPIGPVYARCVRATFLWAGLAVSIAVVLVLPIFAVGVFSLVWAAEVSTAAVGSGLVTMTLASLYLFGVLRVVVLSVRAVLRWRGYPERHWRIVQESTGGSYRIGSLILGFGTLTTVLSILGPDRFSDRAGVLTLFFFVILVLFHLGMVLGMNDVLRHATVVPYFARRVGEIETFARGKALARHVAELDRIAFKLGRPPLSAFGWNDDFAGEELVWHAAETGLATVGGLLDHLETEPPPWGDLDEVIADLKRISHALERANRAEIPFCLLLRHATATNGLEWERRQGTCF